MDMSIKQFSFFNGAPDLLIEAFSKAGNKIPVQDGMCIFDHGKKMEFVAFLMDGRARVYINSESGREITLYYVNPGEMCPTNLMYSLLDRMSPASALAVEPGRAVIIPSNMFRSWMDEYPCVRWSVLDAISAKLIDMMALIEEITFGKLDQRLIDFLRDELNRSSNGSVINMTQEQIAFELGSSREVISRILSDFERTGMVRRGRGNLELLNLEGLDQAEA